MNNFVPFKPNQRSVRLRVRGPEGSDIVLDYYTYRKAFQTVRATLDPEIEAMGWHPGEYENSWYRTVATEGDRMMELRPGFFTNHKGQMGPLDGGPDVPHHQEWTTLLITSIVPHGKDP